MSEYRPGLFVTPDGKSVIFQNGRMSLGNRPRETLASFGFFNSNDAIW
ncbi:MAG TPA: hypothetical protein VJU86_18075 [Pyrinomonadaceae bacterium]|nr:hypothetical protein [Pyrinomonadaceae bacterium]